MRATLLTLAFLLCSAVTALAQSSRLEALSTGNDARGWEAVGRLDIANKGFCTGTLIEPDLVLTAAHCLYQADSRNLVALSDIQFLAGLRNGRPEAARGIRQVLIHPSYSRGGLTEGADTRALRYDIALLFLSHPIQASRISPIEVSNSVLTGTEVGVVSYAQDREEVPSLQKACNVLGEQGGTLIMDCEIDFGASGAPVFRYEAGQARLVSIVSAMAELEGKPISLGPDLAQPLPMMLNEAMTMREQSPAERPTTARVLRSGEQANTGALFVRP